MESGRKTYKGKEGGGVFPVPDMGLEPMTAKRTFPDMGLEPMTSRLRVCHSAN